MKKYFFLLLTVVSLTACEKFLEEVPKDRLSEANFYKTLADARAAVDAIYAPIRTGNVFLGPYFLQVEIMADYSEGRGSTAAVGEYQGLDGTNIGRTELLWAGFYQSINYANIAIEKIPEMTTVSSQQKSQLLAEAKFMRAFNYYHLVRNYGAVPLLLATVNDYSGRKPVNDVYAAIIADLKAGELDLPDVPAQYGRPTRWASKSLLAEVYLTTGDFTEAKRKSEEVIASNKFNLLEVRKADDYNNIFGASANGTVEEIFYLKYSHLSGWQWPHNMLFVGTQYSPFGNYVLFGKLDNKFLNNWDKNDLRKQFGIFTEYINRAGNVVSLPSSTPVQFCKFRDPDAPTNTGHANDYPFLRYADVLMIHSEASCMVDGPTAVGMEGLNRLKRRAYGLPSDQPSSMDYKPENYTKESLRDLIIQERAYEFFMEGKRWLDLKRTGKIESTILANLGKTVKEAHKNWPIPRQEIETNPDISQADQNPGY